MEQNPEAIDKEVASVLSGLGLKAEALSIKDEINELLTSLGYKTAMCGPIQWDCLVIYATPQEAFMLRFDLSPVSEFLAQRGSFLRDIRIKVV